MVQLTLSPGFHVYQEKRQGPVTYHFIKSYTCQFVLQRRRHCIYCVYKVKKKQSGSARIYKRLYQFFALNQIYNEKSNLMCHFFQRPKTLLVYSVSEVSIFLYVLFIYLFLPGLLC